MRGWPIRGLYAAALLGAVLVAAGCGPDPSDTDLGSVVLPTPTGQPAEESGGACQLLDFDEIQAQIGVTFGVAASGNQGNTYTCVLQQTQANLPDLSLALTPSTVDLTTFKKKVSPKGSSSVNELGKVAYSVAVPAGNGAGPGLEVGWLSGNQRLIVLRYQSPNGTAAGDLNALLPKLITLAKQIDLTTA
ncbi:hypothetical protein GCM10023322_16580 [Rugosimonospora acidiphila]|uniref:DUF3558 domain-containing protein n=1 Tax=Rugosimonospora acidiphila TaxID=556531 RepID=A0ABP9RNZ9_9ACTN